MDHVTQMQKSLKYHQERFQTCNQQIRHQLGWHIDWFWQPATVRLLHGTKKTRQIKLSKPINRPENGFKGTGTDIFLKPGKRLNGIDGILLTNTKDQNIISNWKIGKISAYLCRKLKADASGADQVGFHSDFWLANQNLIIRYWSWLSGQSLSQWKPMKVSLGKWNILEWYCLER